MKALLLLSIAAIALGAGALLYAASHPERLVGLGFLPRWDHAPAFLGRGWVRGHAADALFGVAAGALFADWARASLRPRVGAAAGIAVLVALEVLQLVPSLGGTFDPIDIVVEVATFVAVYASAVRLELRSASSRPMHGVGSRSATNFGAGLAAFGHTYGRVAELENIGKSTAREP